MCSRAGNNTLYACLVFLFNNLVLFLDVSIYKKLSELRKPKSFETVRVNQMKDNSEES